MNPKVKQAEIQKQISDIDQMLDGANPFDAYMLRNRRYELLKDAGVPTKRVYPQSTLGEDYVFKHVAPISIRKYGRLNGQFGRCAQCVV